MTSDTRRALAFLGWLLIACLICLSVIIGGVWLVITVLLWLGSSIHIY